MAHDSEASARIEAMITRGHEAGGKLTLTPAEWFQFADDLRSGGGAAMQLINPPTPRPPDLLGWFCGIEFRLARMARRDGIHGG